MVPTAAEQETHTPGFLGYALAVLISITVCAAGFAAMFAIDEYVGPNGPGEFLLWTLVASGYVALLAVPIAVFAVPTVHLLCVRVRQQWIHVAVTALAAPLFGLAAFTIIGAVTEGWANQIWGLVAWTGVSGATGRAAVVPLVSRRRRERASLSTM